MTQSEYQSLYNSTVQYYRTLSSLSEEAKALYDTLPTPRIADELSSTKDLFPVNSERIVITNGIESIVVSDASTEHGATADWAVTKDTHIAEHAFDIAVELKQRHPELPLYSVHNHPSFLNLPIEEVQRVAEHGADPRKIGYIPSKGDIQQWAKHANIIKGAIYLQEYDTFVSYTDDWSEEAERGTQIALDFVPGKPADMWFDATPDKWIPRFAPDNESIPGTVYIPFDQWQEVKSQYNIDWTAAADMMRKK